jgi:hypothetical protein
MSYVDQPERPHRSISERFQDVWEHPTPFGLFAQIKAWMNAPETIRGLVDASRVVTGPAPTTEEEADRYNRAREYLPRAAFEVASAITPTAPRVVGGLPTRPTGGSAIRVERQSQPASGILPGGLPRPSRAELYDQRPAVLRPGGGEGAGSGILGDLVSAPAELPWWMQAFLPPGSVPAGLGTPLPVGAVGRQALPSGLLDTNRPLRILNPRSELRVPETPSPKLPVPSEANGRSSLPPSILGLGGLADPNHRELRRVSQSSPDGVRAGPNGDGKPSPGVISPPLVPDQEPPVSTLEADTSGNGSGGMGGNTGSGGNKAERDRECNQQWQDEKNDHCPQFGGFDAKYRRMCEERALQRLRACFRDQREPPKYSWEDVAREDLEGLQRWRKKEERARNAKRKGK